METDKDCINRENGQLGDDSLASVWGGMQSIGLAVSIYQFMNGSNNAHPTSTSGWGSGSNGTGGGVAGGGYGNGSIQSW